MPPKKKKKSRLTEEELEEQRRKNRERQQLYRQRKKEEKEKEKINEKRELPGRRCRKSSVIDDPTIDSIVEKEKSDSDSDYGSKRRKRETARKRRRRESESELAVTGDEDAVCEIESRKTKNREQHEKLRKARKISATSGDTVAMQKVESIKLANKEQHTKRRTSRIEAAISGNDDEVRNLESIKLANKEQHAKQRTSRLEAATSGNDDEIRKLESIKLANKEQHAKQRTSRLEAAISGNDDEIRNLESAKLSNKMQHARKRASRLDAASSGNESEMQKIELTKLANKIQHDQRRSSRRVAAASGEEQSRQEIEAEKISNRVQHEKERSQLRDAALSGDNESLSKIEVRRVKNTKKHAEKRALKKDNDTLPEAHYLGKMNVECPFCGALHFSGEMRCCHAGTVFVPPERRMPEPLNQLLYDVNGKQHKHFMEHILKYNNLFAFGSVQYQHVRQAPFGVQAAKTVGSLRHFTSAVFPNRENLLYGNFYVLDHVAAAEQRSKSKFAEGLDENIIATLSKVFEENHPFSKFYYNMKVVLDEMERKGLESKSLRMRIVEYDEYQKKNLEVGLQGTHKGVYSTARCGDFVSMYTTTDVDQNILPRGINVYKKLGTSIPRALYPYRREIDSFCYPIIAPFGEVGFKSAHWKHQKPKSFVDRLNEFIDNDKENEHLLWDEIVQDADADKKGNGSDSTMDTDSDETEENDNEYIPSTKVERQIRRRRSDSVGPHDVDLEIDGNMSRRGFEDDEVEDVDISRNEEGSDSPDFLDDRNYDRRWRYEANQRKFRRMNRRLFDDDGMEDVDIGRSEKGRRSREYFDEEDYGSGRIVRRPYNDDEENEFDDLEAAEKRPNTDGPVVTDKTVAIEKSASPDYFDPYDSDFDDFPDIAERRRKYRDDKKNQENSGCDLENGDELIVFKDRYEDVQEEVEVDTFDEEYEKTIEVQDPDPPLGQPSSTVNFEYRRDEFYPSYENRSQNETENQFESDSDHDDLELPNVVVVEEEDISEDEKYVDDVPEFDELNQEHEQNSEHGDQPECTEEMDNEEERMNMLLDPNMAEAEGVNEIHGSYVSLMQYVLYRSQRRKRFRTRMALTGKLGQVYQMDMFSRLIQNRMWHIRKHHTQTMLTTRRKLLQAMQRQADKRKAGVTIGAVTSVPATVMGSPRYMRRKFEDAVALANRLGNPSVFLTFTASSNWKEIKESLGNDTWCNNPYVVTEVFKKKYEKLLEVVCGKPVTKGSRDRRQGLWGEVEWYTFSVEFQQRGAPHIHLLLRLKNPPKTGDDVDLISQAVLPVLPPKDDPSFESIKRLRDLVEQHHIHRPCENDPDSYCNVGRKSNWKTCKKRFPKDFRTHTELGDRRYPDLRRPDDGEYCEKKVKGGVYRADNRHVVAYNAKLLSMFESHINVEVVTSGGALKYLYKYVFKGFDRVLLETFSSDGTSYGSCGSMLSTGHLLYPQNKKMPKGVELVIELDRFNDELFKLLIQEREKDAVKLLKEHNVPLVDQNGKKVVVYDETKLVEDLRAFTATEAAWHFSGYKITGSSHSIMNVFVHTPKDEPIHLKPGTEEEVAEKEEEDFQTALKSWFVANQQSGKSGEKARSLTFEEMPRFFTYKNGRWTMRRRNWSKHIVGHIKAVHPRNTEQFAIRLLAGVVRGPKSFEELRTVDDEICDTFVEAAKRRRLMNDQREWLYALREAASTELPISLRRLFISILVFNAPMNALELWNEMKNELINRNTWPMEKKEAHALNHIQSGLQAHGMTLKQIGLPDVNVADLPAKDDLDDDNSAEELSVRNHEKIADERYAIRAKVRPASDLSENSNTIYKLNSDQKLAMDLIMENLKNHKFSCYFLNGTGGTGKTFLYRTLFHRMKADGFNVICVAHTGIAATLLPAGQTAHRAFSIPLVVEEDMHSKVELESEWADYLRSVDAVVFDEATMLDRRVLKAVDELFVFLHPERQGMLFGGVVFLFGGDWRQTLPIVDRVTGQGIIPYTIRRSDLWNQLRLLELKKNERASADKDYAGWLESIGNGVNYVDDKWQIVQIPKKILGNSEDEVIEWVFGGGRIEDPNTSNYSCLLTVDNRTTEELNDVALGYIRSEMKTYESIDVYDPKSGFEFLPSESYNNMMPSGLPPHLLKLKVGSVVILLRNINVNLGLCNGTRMRVVELGKEIVKCSPIIKNNKTPDTVVLSRIAMSTAKPTSKDVAFVRSQFPIRLAHSMTINKSQGQTLDRVGIILRTPVFSHGQLYVALSRVRKFEDVKMYIHNKDAPDTTRNVVFHDILHD